MSQFGLDSSEPLAAKDEANYQREIACMMHGFGDNPVPNAATVALVESVVHQQMRAMLQEAQKNMELRSSKIISNIDVVYLFRNNKVKLKRFQNYNNTVTLIKQKTKALVGNDGTLPEGCLEEDDSPVGVAHVSQAGGRKLVNDIIANLDNTGEVQSIDFDEVKHLRTVRINQITDAMSVSKYEAYYKARMVSFGRPGFCKTQQKFKSWVNPNSEYNVSQSAYDVLVYLAYETVAEIVDLAFLVRQDAKRRGDDPFSKFGAGNFCNPVSLSNAVYIKSGHEGVPPISVSEIREVLRRVYTPQTGIAGFFYRNMKNELPVKFIAI